MSITPGGNIPRLGGTGPGGTNNPLEVLNSHLGQITKMLASIADNTRPDATAILPHLYVVARQDAEHVGAYWGSFCLACSDSADEFVFPCRVNPDPIHPPQFFTIGDVLEPDKRGRMLRHGTPPS